MANDIAQLQTFIHHSPSPCHVVQNAQAFLRQHSFTELAPGESWQLVPGGRYFVPAYHTTLFAFTIGDAPGPLRMAAAHTDFPCFHLKPDPIMHCENYHTCNVEPYGGMILRTWLDRPLGLAGRVALRGTDAFHPVTVPVDFGRPMLTIPSLAIHMDRKVNTEGKLNPQTGLTPLAALGGSDDVCWPELLAKEVQSKACDILSYELMTYPFEEGCTFGPHDELFSSPRLDNLTSVWACLQGLCQACAAEAPAGVRLIALFDNEEVGSRTKQGAGSYLLRDVLQRIYRSLGTAATLETAMADGFLLSMDVAHGLHPNHTDVSDPAVRPLLGKGVVLKQAASQAYAGDAEAIAIVRALACEKDIPVQDFVNRNDIRGGSTLGSIASAIVPVRTMDVGVPILAMHSARETMATADEASLIELTAAVLG